ncbi:hypothetical protein JD77_05146 [Micromonospora olivasterospora]|uniref:Uncharacterized protein n=1 Tax=Micromonospora olivasterospora TaxID=1880 RepID=A0A562IHC6_MICOL|nr:hypothetical protein JD77_05146 [Micromonospora olivasterospora]
MCWPIPTATSSASEGTDHSAAGLPGEPGRLAAGPRPSARRPPRFIPPAGHPGTTEGRLNATISHLHLEGALGDITRQHGGIQPDLGHLSFASNGKCPRMRAGRRHCGRRERLTARRWRGRRRDSPDGRAPTGAGRLGDRAVRPRRRQGGPGFRPRPAGTAHHPHRRPRSGRAAATARRRCWPPTTAAACRWPTSSGRGRSPSRPSPQVSTGSRPTKPPASPSTRSVQRPRPSPEYLLDRRSVRPRGRRRGARRTKPPPRCSCTSAGRATSVPRPCEPSVERMLPPQSSHRRVTAVVNGC